MPEHQQPSPFDPSIIDAAPIDPDDELAIAEDNFLDAYSEIVGELSERLAQAEAEVARLEAEQTVEQVKARLLRPYSQKVFWFVVGYCAVVAIMLFLSGWSGRSSFKLSDTILSIIAGSTAVAVIGLIGMVVSGLYGSGKKD